MILNLIRQPHTQLGITLTEIMVAMAASGILLGAMASSFIAQQRGYTIQNQMAKMTVDARTALERISQDIRLAGYGVPPGDLDDWIDWVQDERGETMALTDVVSIIDGVGEPDQLRLIGAFDRPVAHLMWGAVEGARHLRLHYDSGADRLDLKSRKLVYIARNESALVTAAPGRRRQVRIRIDTDPHTAGHQGIASTYPGRPLLPPVELVSVVTYQIVIDHERQPPVPVLTRNRHEGDGPEPIAEHIEDLRLSRDGDRLRVEVTARTANPDPKYVHPQAGDRYRRRTLAAWVRLRGLSPDPE